MSLRPAAALPALLVLAACGEPKGPAPAPSATAAATLTAATPTAPRAEPSSAAATGTAAAGDGTPHAAADAALAPAPAASPAIIGTGAGDCQIARGPVRLGTTGAVVFGPSNGVLLPAGVNREGAPAWESPTFPDPPRVAPGASPAARGSATAPALLPGPGPSPAASAPAADGVPERTRLPACAVAGGFTFCADSEGAIHRRPAAGGDDRVLAHGRKGTPVSAAALGGHTFYTFLANQKTTEGLVVRAFAGLDDETPIPLSEEGSGATFVDLVARDADVLAMYIDARTALTPVHARTLRAEGKLARGADAVVFVGAGADTIVRGALGRGAGGPALLFVPSSPDDRQFGVVAVAVDGEPKDDMPGKWAMYPAAMVSPALATTRGATPVRLLRARPETADAGAAKVLELGHVGADGAFQDRCIVAKGGPFSDLAAAVDGTGALWIAYTNATGTWVEQRTPDAGGK